MADYRNRSAINALPEHMRAAMLRWIEQGVYPGGFLTAVLENNLCEAVARADHINIDKLPDYVRYLYNNAPRGCWGNPDSVRAWHREGGLMRGLVGVSSEPENQTEENDRV